MREIKPPDTKGLLWNFLGTTVSYVDVTENGWGIEYSEEAKGPWLGFVRFFTNPQGVICRDFDFLNKGVVVKVWGFEEDFKTKRVCVAILYQGKWFLKEDQDDLYYDADFTNDGSSVSLFWIEFSNNCGKIRVEIKAEP